MQFSLLPIFVIGIFAFLIFITLRAKKNKSIDSGETRAVGTLLFALFIWTLVTLMLGIKGIHASPSLRERVPLLWQALAPIIILIAFFPFSKNLVSGLRALATHTPKHWLVFIQTLRIGAIGTIIKGITGEISSDFVFWVGIPDFLFGLSAIAVGWFTHRNAISHRFLIFWNIVGLALILVPLLVFMPYFMSQPGFIFIFEFPMVLAPSIVVPLLLFINFLMAWNVYEKKKMGAWGQAKVNGWDGVLMRQRSGKKN